MEMDRDFGENAAEGADAEVRMIGNGHVMFSAVLRRESHVTARFSSDRVPIPM